MFIGGTKMILDYCFKDLGIGFKWNLLDMSIYVHGNGSEIVLTMGEFTRLNLGKHKNTDTTIFFARH